MATRQRELPPARACGPRAIIRVGLAPFAARQPRVRQVRSNSKSIASVTEQMTQMALAAKNEELERLTTRQHKLLAGVAEVLQLLRQTSERHGQVCLRCDSHRGRRHSAAD